MGMPATARVTTVRVERATFSGVSRVTVWLSAALAVVGAVVSATTFFFWGVLRDNPGAVGNLRGTCLAILVVAVPVLVASMAFSARGSLAAKVVWLAALGYFVYNSVLLNFAMFFNSFFFLWVAMLSLSVWSFFLLLRDIDVEAIRARASRVPVRVIAAYLLLCLVVYAIPWLKGAMPGVLHNTSPAAFAGTRLLTSPVWVLDFAFSFPLLALSAVWIWRRAGWGYVAGGALIMMLTIETSSVAIDQVFGHRHDPAQSLGSVPLMIALTVVGLVMSVLYLRGFRESSRQSAATL